MNRCIKMGVLWSLPYSDKKITTTYILPVPNGITPSYYLWIATGRRAPYKLQCFINRLKKKKEFLFIQ